MTEPILPLHSISRRHAMTSLASLSAAATAACLAVPSAVLALQNDPMSSPVRKAEPDDTPHAAGWDPASRQYVLPPLPYEYADLEPHIDEETMRLHHDKHHDGYVKGLNRAMDTLATLRAVSPQDENTTRAVLRDLAFHGSGHFLHCLFWQCMASPKNGAGGTPATGGALAKRIERDFGSFKQFSEQFQAAAMGVQGSGWAILVHEPVGGRLMVMQAEKHQDVAAWGAQPLLPLDVWEHAYYVKYRNRRKEYVSAFMNVINWDFAGRRFEACQNAG